MPDASDRNLGWSELLGMGAISAAQVAVGVGLGWLVDSFADTTPVFLLVGLLLGIVGAAGYIVIEFRKFLNS